MPDTFTPDQFSQAQAAPPVSDATPCAKARQNAKRATYAEFAAPKPMAFVDSIAKAMEPFLDTSYSVRKGVSTADMVEALRPIMGQYTIADAAFVRDALENIANYGCVQDIKRSAAEFTSSLLEDFICSGAAASPQDAAARSSYVNFGKRYVGERDSLLLMLSLTDDVRAIQRGDFTEGQLFGGKDASEDNAFVEEPWWVSREKRLEQAGLKP